MAIDIEAPGAHDADLKAALLELLPFRGVRVRRTSDQLTANYTTATAIPWQEAPVDTDLAAGGAGFWSAGTPERIATIPAAYNGRHANAQASVRVDLGTADTTADMLLTQYSSGGVEKYAAAMTREGGSSTAYLSAALIGVPIATGDYFTVRHDEESDNSITIKAGIVTGAAVQIF